MGTLRTQKWPTERKKQERQSAERLAALCLQTSKKTGSNAKKTGSTLKTGNTLKTGSKLKTGNTLNTRHEIEKWPNGGKLKTSSAALGRDFAFVHAFVQLSQWDFTSTATVTPHSSTGLGGVSAPSFSWPSSPSFRGVLSTFLSWFLGCLAPREEA